MRNINWLGLPVAVICSAVSLGLIFDYAVGASDNPWRVAAYGAVGVAAVLWEVAGLHRGDHLRRAKRRGAALACYFGLAVAILITVSYEIGSLAELLESKASIGESRAGERAALEQERSVLLAQVKKAGEPRPAGAIQGDIDAIKAHPRWASSGGCTNATAQESKDLCVSYGRLAAEAGAAAAIAAASARIIELNRDLAPLAASKVADARASYLSKLSGLPEIDSRIAVSLLVIVFLLFGRVAGGYVFMDAREQRAEIATASQAVTEAPTAANQIARTHVAPEPVFLPPIASLADEDIDFDEGMTAEDIEALWNREQADKVVAAMSAGEPEPLPVKAEPAPLNPVQVARRELVLRFAADCLVFHRAKAGDEKQPRESAKLVWEGFELWCEDMEIGDKLTRAAFGTAFGMILEDNGGRSHKNSEIYYVGVTLTPAWSHRVAKRADAITEGTEEALPAVTVGEPRLGGRIRDRRALAIETEAAGTA